jgi:hypothetical protein
MYAGLTEEEEASLEARIDERLDDAESRHPATRRRTRNHILLTRRKQL